MRKLWNELIRRTGGADNLIAGAAVAAAAAMLVCAAASCEPRTVALSRTCEPTDEERRQRVEFVLACVREGHGAPLDCSAVAKSAYPATRCWTEPYVWAWGDHPLLPCRLVDPRSKDRSLCDEFEAR